MDTPKTLTPFEKFAARRIAEFPTLYHCKEDVITQCILGSQGDCVWKNGVLVQPNYHLNKKSKKRTQYPLRISIAAASEFRQYKVPSVSYDIGSGRAPISNLPRNADKSYLDAIDIFLFVWEGLGESQWKTLAEAYCLTMWKVTENPHAGEPDRTLTDYLRFMKFIPKWRAAIREIEYFQEHGEVDARTFQGENI